MKTLNVKNENQVLTVELARPEVRNAFNEVLISELQQTFESASKNNDVRVVVLRGQGPTFSAGGDLNWMQKSISMTEEQNLVDTRKLTKMFATMNECSKPVVGLLHGAAIGGGVGLTSVCDYVVASKETVFSLSEVRLGLIPACIAPFVIAKIGESFARAFFISAERFSTERAYEAGLIHEIVDTPGALDASRDRIVGNLLQAGPSAIHAAKKLIRDLRNLDFNEGMDYGAKMLAHLRVTEEGQEGLKAFLEKRKPNWVNQKG